MKNTVLNFVKLVKISSNKIEISHNKKIKKYNNIL